MKCHAITIDVEDGISIAMRDAFGIISDQTDRVVHNTNLILELLSRHQTKATFFVLGVVAKNNPELIRQIANEGHELAIHGFNHYRFDKMNPDSAYQELKRAKNLVEDISGQEMFGHRAPAFSINPETSWGLDVIFESGFKYDSSIMPCHSFNYGWRNFKKHIHHLTTPKGYKLIEAPLTTGKLFNLDFPVGGGSHLRLMPYFFTKYFLKKNEKQRNNIIYVHPYEIDIERYPDYYYSELKRSNFIKQIRMRSFWINRKSVLKKINLLLSDNTYVPLRDVIERSLEVKMS